MYICIYIYLFANTHIITLFMNTYTYAYILAGITWQSKVSHDKGSMQHIIRLLLHASMPLWALSAWLYAVLHAFRFL